jgi:EAL domain-containing protein (putative c-di-GMP-specific phosphodiesterase class I)
MLVRMLDLDGEVIPPAAFLPAAERFELIGDIDRWVVEETTEILRRATAAGIASPLSINVSARSLRDEGLVDLIAARLRETRIDPALLIVEIAETAVISDINSARRFALRLQALGCRLALDDFGSGFGSFLYLKHLPFDFLKIDSEYVSSCLVSRADELLIESVVTMAHGLGKTTIAEHTPDAQTLRCLAARGVDLTQSFLTGHPVPAEEALFGGTPRPLAARAPFIA